MSGIYKILCLINNKSYIGQSINIQKRFNSHKYDLNRGKHRIKQLQDDWNKYGPENFVFEILEECTRKDLGKLEQRYIRSLNTTDPNCGYNTLKSQYVAANPNRSSTTYVPKPMRAEHEPEIHGLCKNCSNECKQYNNAEIIVCPKKK